MFAKITLVHAGIAHLVERHLAKVEVASSSLVARSKKRQDIRFGCPVVHFMDLPETQVRSKAITAPAILSISSAGMPAQSIASWGSS